MAPIENTAATPVADTAKPAKQTFKILTGDVLQQLSSLPANFFDAMLSDAPYGLSDHGDIAPVLQCWLNGETYKHPKKGFMGQDWDSFVPGPDAWRACYRVLKPGAFSLVFAGTRTQDLMGISLRLGGFELRDQIAYLYGSGFPKSHNISKAIDKKAGVVGDVIGTAADFARDGCKRDATKHTGERTVGVIGDQGGGWNRPITAPATPAAIQWAGYGTALKPAVENALLVMKPLDGTFANNALTHGCGGLNIDGCRIETPDGKPAWNYPNGPGGQTGEGTWTDDNCGFRTRTEAMQAPTTGRFPANLILDEESAAALDSTVGVLTSGKMKAGTKRSTRAGNALGEQCAETLTATIGDKGGPSRFFYTSKVGGKERNAGCAMPSNHPTMKPLSLTTYLAKLLLPPVRTLPKGITAEQVASTNSAMLKAVGQSAHTAITADGTRHVLAPRRIIVPFSGSGSEMIGCLLAGWDEVYGIEIDPSYVEIAKARIVHWVPNVAEIGDEK